MENTRFKISQYACAVLLIVSSIALVAYQVVSIEDVAAGLLYYVAQSFLLAGSIFGLDQYIRIIKRNKRARLKLSNNADMLADLYTNKLLATHESRAIFEMIQN